MTTGAASLSQRRFGNAVRPLRSVILHADTGRDASTDDGSCHDHTIVIEDLDPVVVFDIHLLGIFVIHPQRIDAARQRCHALVVAVGRVDMPLAVRGEEVQHDDFARLLAHLAEHHPAVFAKVIEVVA